MKLRRFTLVELIAAMAVLAMIGSAAAAALAGFQRSHNKVVQLSERLERNRKLDKLAELMGNMIPFFWRDENEDDAENLVFDGKEDELHFTAMRLPDSRGQGALIFVRLYVNDEKSLAGQAYINIAKRIMGEEVPFLDIDTPTTIIDKIKNFFLKKAQG